MNRSGRTSRVAAAAAAALLLCVPGKAYYQYVHYLTNFPPFTPVYEKFDLTALVNNTVAVYVSDQGPGAYGVNDSFGSVLSQVKMAVAAWNTVSTSQLKLAFGGLETPGQPSNTPGIDVIFTDLPPGILGLGAPTTSVVPANRINDRFFPIVRGTVMLVRNTAMPPGPSYLEGYYTTAIHEIGHALGLQHTWTSSAMSQDITRNTSRARPLDADDRASLSVLYGAPGWQTAYGSISGRVTFNNGQPVALASVVAIPPNGPAVSALTDPNGSYTIQGLPANNYLLYVHPLPPDATMNDALRLPLNASQQPIARSGMFQTVFYPGTLDPNQATAIPITAGPAVQNLNFTVAPRNSATIYDVVTYTRLNSATRTYIYSGDLTVPQAYIQIPLSSYGLITVMSASMNPTPVPQSALVLGGLGNAASIAPYTDGSGAVALYFNPGIGAGTGPRHLVMNFGNDIYVLPDAVDLVQNGPPQINSVIPNADGSVTLAGVGFGPDSTVFFDGLQAAVATPFNGSSMTVIPPQGASGQTSTLTVFNSDGQNSMILQSQAPQTYSYPFAAPPQISVTPAALPAGQIFGSSGIPQAAMVDITGINTNFIDGQTTVGFGSDDVTVRRVWVLSPTHLVADVMVAPNGAIGTSEISVISGFQSAVIPGGFQTQPPAFGQPLIALPIVNASAGQQTIYPGSFATIYGVNLGASAAAVQLTLGGAAVPVSFASPNQINFQVPPGFPTGPATLQLASGGIAALPVVIQISNPPPNITSVTNVSGVPLSALNYATVGDILNINVTALDPTVVGNLSRLQVTISGLPMQVLQVTPLAPGQFQIQIVITQSFGGTQVPLAVAVDGSSSTAVTVTVR